MIIMPNQKRGKTKIEDIKVVWEITKINNKNKNGCNSFN
jgi:hypothetical protein